MFYWKNKRFVFANAWATPFLVCFLWAYTTGCSSEQSDTALYYPVDSLLNAQIATLLKANASVRKVGLLNDEETKMKLTPRDSGSWAKELNVFFNLHAMNKPVNRGAYTVKEHESDSKSNLLIKSFTSTREIPVEFLKIYYDGSLDKIRKIESRFTESNLLYRSTRLLYMEFEQIDEKPVLTYYAVTGGQKIFLGDSLQYRINAAVSIP